MRALVLPAVAVGCAACHHPRQAASEIAPRAASPRTSPTQPPAALSTPSPRDPSVAPLVAEESGWFIERFRIVADVDFDGVSDLMLSESVSLFGNAGGFFDIYKGASEGRFTNIGSVFAHPLAVSLTKREGGGGILTTCHRSSCRSGSLTRYRVTAESVTKLDHRTIYPGDNGTPEGRAEYARVFNDADRLRPEISTTRDGAVTWKRYGR